jgi:hypothetical protein
MLYGSRVLFYEKHKMTISVVFEIRASLCCTVVTFEHCTHIIIIIIDTRTLLFSKYFFLFKNNNNIKCGVTF